MPVRVITQYLFLCDECGRIVEDLALHKDRCPGEIGWSKNNMVFVFKHSDPPWTVFN